VTEEALIPLDEARRAAEFGVYGVRVAKPRAANAQFRLVPFDKIKQPIGNNYVVKGLIPAEGLVVAWGPPKCGKTFWVFDLSMHVALDRQYRGRRITAGPVVYIACEGERGLPSRVEAFRRERMAEDASGTAFYLLATRLDLVADGPQLIAHIRAQLPDAACSVVVVDTLNRSLRGSESSDEDMADYIRAADAIREAFRCAVVIIHHSGIADSRPRGHTSLTGAADVQIAVKKDAAGIITATVEFAKDGEAGAEIRSALRVIELDPDEDGERVTSCVIEPIAGSSAETQPTKKISAAAKQAFDLLVGAVAAGGGQAPASSSDHVPAGVQGVTKAVWRSYLEKGGIVNADGSPREQMRRFIVTLKDAGFIGVWDDFVWPRHKPSQERHVTQRHTSHPVTHSFRSVTDVTVTANGASGGTGFNPCRRSRQRTGWHLCLQTRELKFW
jgi:AAA domain